MLKTFTNLEILYHLALAGWQPSFTPWVIAIIAGLLILLIIRYYEKKQQKRKIARQEQLRQQLHRVDKLKDQFLQNTSHEMRTPLQGIIGLSETLYDESEVITPEKLRRDLAMVIASGKQLANLVSDLLDFARLKHADLRLCCGPVELYALTEVVLVSNAPLAHGKSLQLINEVPENLPIIQGDENRVQQVLFNLVGNAVKFTAEGSVKVGAVKREKVVEVYVCDTGIGIPENKREAIFQELEQTDGSDPREFARTGLGLSVSKRIIELHGGEMWVDSEMNCGSTFHFTLPIGGPPEAGAPETQSPEEEGSYQLHTLLHGTPEDVAAAHLLTEPSSTPGMSRQPGARILVVDDDPVSRAVFCNYLTNGDYKIVPARNGREALEILDADPSFDLVVLDVMMPYISGFEVCRRIREKHLPSALPVIMVTAKSQVKDLVQGFQLGANDYLSKPFTKAEFLARVHTQLNLHRINNVTNKFVPQKFIQALGRNNITEICLGDFVEREVSVLFTDIRNYTALAEEMTPEQNFRFVNAYEGRMGPIIRQHSGFVNQYLGDGIMAIFPDDPAEALAGAIGMQHSLTRYNMRRRRKQRRPIQVGMGLHTGPLIMGIIGDEWRLEAATISDTVNTASRIESLSKYFSVRILLSEDHLELLPSKENHHFRFLGVFQMKGKKQSVRIYECFDGDPAPLFAKKKALQPAFDLGLRHYFQREFRLASLVLEEAKSILPEDPVIRHFLERAKRYQQQTLPANWQDGELLT